jgi:hypothetical protein
MATNAAVKYERLLGFHEINFILAFGPRNMIILFLNLIVWFRAN